MSPLAPEPAGQHQPAQATSRLTGHVGAWGTTTVCVAVALETACPGPAAAETVWRHTGARGRDRIPVTLIAGTETGPVTTVDGER